MGKDSPAPPAAPDYTGAAAAQGAANEATARLQGRLNNPNVYGPLGSQTVSFGTPSFNQAGYDTAMAKYGAGQPTGPAPTQAQYTSNVFQNDGNGSGNVVPQLDQAGYDRALASYNAGPGPAPTREQFTTMANADQPTITQSLNPEAQGTLEAQQRVQRNLANLGLQGIGTAQNVLGSAFNPNLPGIQTNLGNAGQIPQTPDLSRYGQASGLQGQQLGDGRGNRPLSVEETTSMNNQNPFGGKNAPPPSTGNLGNDFEMPRDVAAKFAALRNVPLGGPGRELYTPTNNQGNIGQTPQAPELSVYGMAGAGPQAGQYGYAQGGLNTSNVAAMPVNAGMTGQQAIMNRLAPALARSDAATQQRLANQGLVPGGEAYENAMISQNQQKNDLLSQAALQGIGLDTAANAQGFGQALQAGQYGNQAVAQNFGLGQAANAAQNAAIGQNQQAALAQYQAQLGGQQQGFGQQVTQRQLGNQAIGQNQQTALQQQQAALAAQNQQYNQLLAGAQFGNTAQQQSLGQQLQLRGQPLNEIIGLMGGSQIQMPQFQGYQPTNIAPAPVFAGAQAAGQAGMQNYGIQQSGANAQTAGLYGLGAAGAGAYGMMNAAAPLAFSDRRLKSNVERVGTHSLGIGIYEYDIFGERQRGVMADEVEAIMPKAVIKHPSGFKMVNYGALQ